MTLARKIDGLTDSRYLGKLCKRGHDFQGTGMSLRFNATSTCIECERERGKKRICKNYERQKKWAKKNPDKVQAQALRRKETGYYKQHWKAYYGSLELSKKISLWLSSVKRRAEKLGMDYDLTPEWVLQNLSDCCPVLGIPMEFGGADRKKANPNSASIDRFDNKKGYTMDNCRIISRRANVLKSDATIEEMELVLKYMRTSP